MTQRWITFAAVFCLGISSCTKTDRHTAAPAPLPIANYAALQRQAEACVPSVGKPGGEIVLATFAGPSTFNPITATDASTGEITGMMYEGLVHINGVTLQPEPGLAESWEVSPDGLVWTFRIRPAVTWSDGAPFTSADVVFTLNDLVLGDSTNPSRGLFTIANKKMKVEAVDSLHVRCMLPAPYAPFLRAMSQAIVPKHRLRQFVKSRTFAGTLGVTTPPESMVVTGPFMLASYAPSREIVLKRNPRYWQVDSAGTRLPYLDRVVYVVVTDASAELLRFRTGGIDYYSARGEDFAVLTQDAVAGKFSVHRLGPGTGSTVLVFNQNTGKDSLTGKPFVDSAKVSWFRNESFRTAVSCAIDRAKIVDTVMHGMGFPQWSPQFSSGADAGVAAQTYDPDSARALLGRAGFTDKNSDGILDDSAARPVILRLVTNRENGARAQIAQIIAANLEALGVKVSLQQVEFDGLIRMIDNPPYDWDAVLIGLTGNPEPHFGRNVWHSSGALHMWFPRQASPSTDWEARIDSLFDAGVRELDPQRRTAIYAEWQRIATDKLPMIYTVLPERILCISTKFRNVNPSPVGGLLHNVEWLYVGQ